MKVLMNKEHWKLYPDCPKEFPNELLSSEYANHIHGQTLKRLDERGGLSPAEIVGNVNKLEWNFIVEMTKEDAIRRIKKYIENHNLKQTQ